MKAIRTQLLGINYSMLIEKYELFSSLVLMFLMVFAQRLCPLDGGIKEDIRQVQVFGIMRQAAMWQNAGKPAGNLRQG